MDLTGSVVEYVDERGKPHAALVTADWGVGSPDDDKSVNVVWVVGDESQTDSYGRQIARATSVVNEARQAAPGLYWRRKP